MDPRTRIAVQFPDQLARVIVANPCDDDHFVLAEIPDHPNVGWLQALSCWERLGAGCLSQHNAELAVERGQ